MVRAGTGENVNILNDPWLPCKSNPHVQTNNVALNGRNVASLMVTGQNRWDTDLINDMFNSRDANLILSLPLSSSVEDSWYWRNEKLGHYTVKSAYAVISESREQNTSSDNSGFWLKIWNLKIPLKVKHFLWRALRDCLPVKQLLISKHVNVNNICPVCNIEPETVFHALVSCKFANSCWQEINLMTNMTADHSFLDHMVKAIEIYIMEELNKICMLAWSIWNNRNEIVWKQKGTEFSRVVASAFLSLSNWQNAQDKSFDLNFGFVTKADGEVHWQRPQEGIVKFNTDAAIYEDTGRFSYAAVARDHDGKLLEAISSCKQGQLDPELAEAIGIGEALSWVKNKAWPEVVLETDCLVVTQAIRCSTINLSYLGRVVENCKKILSNLGKNWYS